MENKITNEEAARVFAMYLGCECTQAVVVPNQDLIWENSTVSSRTLFNIQAKLFEQKLLLTPLSAISDEHAIEVAKITGWEAWNHVQIVRYKDRVSLFNQFSSVSLPFGTNVKFDGLTDKQFQYLIQKGYAVPIFIAPNHPLNGKDAIQLGIAIDKTKQ